MDRHQPVIQLWDTQLILPALYLVIIITTEGTTNQGFSTIISSHFTRGQGVHGGCYVMWFHPYLFFHLCLTKQMQISVINVVDTIDLARRFILSWQATVLNTKLWIKESMFYKQLNVNVKWYPILFFLARTTHIFFMLLIWSLSWKMEYHRIL